MNNRAMSDTLATLITDSGFTVPRRWQGRHVLLIPADPDWASVDYEAVQVSRLALRGFFGPGDPWPPADLTLADNRSDLAWHAREFRLQRSFAYHLMGTGCMSCLGCLYLYPSLSAEHDAEAYLWTRSDLATEPSRAMEAEVVDWVTQVWPFTMLAWPGRNISWAAWPQDNRPSYYVRRHQR
ncbi:MAG: hypothetical protein KGY54_04000 [Oleiphilaceae bacterium]|nr:hypothetical protein [Oleiphilaceae bacterium]